MANKDTKCPHCNTFPVGDNVCVTTACERCAKTNFVEDTEETIESGKL